jgi:hypothetical protein
MPRWFLDFIIIAGLATVAWFALLLIFVTASWLLDRLIGVPVRVWRIK